MMVEGKEKTGKALPDGWRWVKFGDVCEIVMGQSPPGTSYNSDGNGDPLLNGPTEFGSVHPKPMQWTTEPKRFAEKDDILFCVRGATTGRKNIADRRYCIGRGLAAIRGRDGSTDTVFLYLLLDQITQTLLGETAGSTFPNLSGAKFNSFRIPLPPIEEQRRIVAILSERLAAVDQARQATQAQLEAAQTLPAAYLREIFNSPEAQTWEKKRLGDIAETSSGSTPSRQRDDYYIGEIPWVKTGELKDDIICDTEEHISELALKETSVKLLPKDSLLVAMYGQGQTRGRTGILALPATTNQACFAIQPNDKLFDTRYLQLWFRHNYSRLREETEGRGGNQPNLNGDLLRGQMIALPSVKVQKDIIEKLQESGQEVDKLKQSLQDQLDTINALPAALLRQAFSGEL